jgi:hypothetical protein
VSESDGRARAFGRHLRETWHEGVTLAAGYVVAAAWKAVGLPSVYKLAGGSARIAYEFVLLLYFAG